MAKVALLVGVSQYQPGLVALPNAVNDVDAVQQVLENPRLGGFATAEIHALKNPSHGTVERALLTLFANRSKDDLVLVYFSGHGVRDAQGHVYLATRDTGQEGTEPVATTAVAVSRWQEMMNRSRSRRIVIVLDACLSGMMSEPKTALAIATQLQGPGRAILTAAASTPYSLAQNGTPISTYTRHFIDGLQQSAADRDNDGWISVHDLHDYIRRQLQKTALPLTPALYPPTDGQPIVLARSCSIDPVLRYRQHMDALIKEDNGTLSFLNRVYLDELRTSLGLSPEEAHLIETQALQPYAARSEKLQRYRQVLVEAIQRQYPLSELDRNALGRLQNLLKLTNEEVAPIQAAALAQRSVPVPTPMPAIAPPPAPLLLTPPAPTPPSNQSPKSPEPPPEAVQADYRHLQSLLMAERWKDADEETSALMLKIAGCDRKNWMDEASIDQFPCADLKRIDQLWVQGSHGRFGFSVQQRILASVNGDWDAFGERVGWCRRKRGLRRGEAVWKSYDALTFSTNAPSGHFPVLVVWEWTVHLLGRMTTCQSRTSES